MDKGAGETRPGVGRDARPLRDDHETEPRRGGGEAGVGGGGLRLGEGGRRVRGDHQEERIMGEDRKNGGAAGLRELVLECGKRIDEETARKSVGNGSCNWEISESVSRPKRIP